MTEKPIAAGKSSYDMIDALNFWSTLAIKDKTIMMDLGCGVGNYAIQAVRYVGPKGLIYAVDAWSEGIERLKERAVKADITNIRLQDQGRVAHPKSRLKVARGVTLRNFCQGENGLF